MEPLRTSKTSTSSSVIFQVGGGMLRWLFPDMILTLTKIGTIVRSRFRQGLFGVYGQKSGHCRQVSTLSGPPPDVHVHETTRDRSDCLRRKSFLATPSVKLDYRDRLSGNREGILEHVEAKCPNSTEACRVNEARFQSAG